MLSCKTSTKAATSWLVIASRASTRATNAASITGALLRHSSATFFGTTPVAANASVTASSISSHRDIFASSENNASVSGVEYRLIINAPPWHHAMGRCPP